MRHGHRIGPGERSRHPEHFRDGAIDPHAGTGIVERITAQAMAQGRWRYAAQMLVAHGLFAFERGQRARARISVNSPRRPSVPSAMQSLAARSNAVSDTLTDGKRFARRRDLLAQLRLFLGPCRDERGGIAFEFVAAAYDLDTAGKVVRRLHLNRHAEPIQQLRPQLALFRIAGADQHEPRRMTDTQPFALDDVFAGCGDIEQEIDQMIFQQIGFINVKEPAMRPRQQSRLECLFAARQCPFQIERADDAVLGRAERQVDDRHRHLRGFQCALGRAGTALVAEFRRLVWIAI